MTLKKKTAYARQMRFRVMTYNLLYGFHDRLSDDSLAFFPERMEAAYEVIAEAKPDILALTEAVFCVARSPRDARVRLVRQQFERALDLPHWFADGAPGDWSSCLLSRYPIARRERLPLGSSPSGTEMSALRAELAIDGRRLLVDVVHPSPHISERARVEAFEPLLVDSSHPHVMLGDFNALSDEDPYTFEGLVEDMRPFRKNAEEIARAMLDRQLLKRLREHGLRDALPLDARTPTIPSRLARPSTEGARLRIDYVLVSKELRSLGGHVVKSEAADRASDHYPVVVDLEID